MKLLLSGFSSRDEMAFHLFLKRFMPAWRWQGQPAQGDQVLPGVDLLVIDMAAHGWAQRTDAGDAQLLLATGSTVAILLTSAHDTSWVDAVARHVGQWVLLTKPYNAESMRNALSQAANLVKAQHKRLASVPSQATAIPEHNTSADGLAVHLAGLPADRHLMLRKLLAALQQQLPFEVRFTLQHFLIIHPVDHWVASNTPMQVVLRVGRSDTLAMSVSVRQIDMDQVEERLHHHRLTPHDLGDFLLELVSSTPPTVLSQATPYV